VEFGSTGRSAELVMRLFRLCVSMHHIKLRIASFDKRAFLHADVNSVKYSSHGSKTKFTHRALRDD
jgi:hypothetical protein